MHSCKVFTDLGFPWVELAGFSQYAIRMKFLRRLYAQYHEEMWTGLVVLIFAGAASA